MKVKVSFEAQIEEPFDEVRKGLLLVTARLSAPGAGNLWIPADAQIEYPPEPLVDGIYLPPDNDDEDACPRLRYCGEWYAWADGEWHIGGLDDDRIRRLGYIRVGQEVKT